MRRSQLLFIVAIIALAVGYFALRLPNLTLQPIFADEAIYIRWAQVMKSEPTLRFLPLSDGKTPLYMWVMMPVFKVISDPLLAGRLLSVMVGFVTLVGVMALGWKFLNRRVALWAGLLMVVTPWVFLFDRMALVDSMLAACSIWSLFLVLWLAQSPRLDLAMILGFVLGAGVLTKTPGMFQILLVPTGVVAFWQHHRGQGLAKFLGMVMVAIAMALVIYNLLRLGPGFSSLSSRNGDYVHPVTRLLEHPLDPLMPHLRDLADWAPKLLSWPVLFIVIVGLTSPLVWRKQKNLWTIWLWGVVPLVVLMALLKTFTARYILFSLAPMLILGAFSLDQLLPKSGRKQLVGVVVVAVLVIVSSLQFNLVWLTKPELAPLPRSERHGYLEEWTSGPGLKEIASYLIAESKNGKIVVGTEGYFGTLPDGLFIYLDKEPNIAVIGSQPQPSESLRASALERPTYFVANKSRVENGVLNVELIQQYPKPARPDGTNDAILFFKLIPVASSAATLR